MTPWRHWPEIATGSTSSPSVRIGRVCMRSTGLSGHWSSRSWRLRSSPTTSSSSSVRSGSASWSGCPRRMLSAHYSPPPMPPVTPTRRPVARSPHVRSTGLGPWLVPRLLLAAVAACSSSTPPPSPRCSGRHRGPASYSRNRRRRWRGPASWGRAPRPPLQHRAGGHRTVPSQASWKTSPAGLAACPCAWGRTMARRRPASTPTP
mmetsp:Transcript_11710/g.37236  ORF Transcript_11710/g.37236 Transcript_11710/m.37236 type:complete len:205 (+) Transcript_11710:412-1026(+)